MLLLLLPLAPPTWHASTVPCTPLTYLPDDLELRCFAHACSAVPLSPRLEKVHAALMRCGLNRRAARLKLRNCIPDVDEAERQRDRMRRDSGARAAVEHEVVLMSLVAQAQQQAAPKRPTALAIAPAPSLAAAAASARSPLRRLPPLHQWAGAVRNGPVLQLRPRRLPPFLGRKREAGDESASPPTPSPPTLSPLAPSPPTQPPTQPPTLWTMAKAATARGRQRPTDKQGSGTSPPPAPPPPAPPPPPRSAPAPVASPETNGPRHSAPIARAREGALRRARSLGPSSWQLPSSASDVRPAVGVGICVLAVGALVL